MCKSHRISVALVSTVLIFLGGSAAATTRLWNVFDGNWSTAGNWTLPECRRPATPSISGYSGSCVASLGGLPPRPPRIFKAWLRRSMVGGEKDCPGSVNRQDGAACIDALSIRLSLVGLRPRRARLRFAG